MASCKFSGGEEPLLEKRQFPDVNKRDEEYDPDICNYNLTQEDKRKYDTWFDEEKPQAGLVSVDIAKHQMMYNSLVDTTAEKILELCDEDGDGYLDRHQWTVARFLELRAMWGDLIPDQVVTWYLLTSLSYYK